MFGFCRLRRSLQRDLKLLLKGFIEVHPSIDYNTVLAKNAPLPEDWAEWRVALEKAAAGDHRKQVFSVLFEHLDTPPVEVANFLREVMSKLLPKDFLVKQNKKLFYKKLYKFVDFNHYESFVKKTLLQGFDLDKVKWLRFDSSSKNAKFF